MADFVKDKQATRNTNLVISEIKERIEPRPIGIQLEDICGRLVPTSQKARNRSAKVKHSIQFSWPTDFYPTRYWYQDRNYDFTSESHPFPTCTVSSFDLTKLQTENLENLQEELATEKSPYGILGRLYKITSSSNLETAVVEDSRPAKFIHSRISSTSKDDGEVKSLHHRCIGGDPEMNVPASYSELIAAKTDSAAATPGVELESQQFVLSKDAGKTGQAPDYADNAEYNAIFLDNENPFEQDVETFLKEREEADKPMRRNGTLGDMTHQVFKAYYELERRKAENFAIIGQLDLYLNMPRSSISEVEDAQDTGEDLIIVAGRRLIIPEVPLNHTSILIWTRPPRRTSSRAHQSLLT
ncbi:hypothetical protein RUND412_006696 [Rhizina undulata]